MNYLFTFLLSVFIVLESTAQAPVVIELFTSQGCSTCPAADRLVSRIANEPNSKNSNIIFLSIHVDYWNRQGYTDPFSKNEFTSRQRAYSSMMKLGSYYTPQAIVNGTTEFIGSNEKRMRSEISKAKSRKYESKIESAKVVLTDKMKLKINYKLKKIDLDDRIYIAYVLDKATTKIGRGENSGVTLEETNIVSQLIKAINTLDGEQYILTDKEINVSNSHIVIFIQSHDTLHIEDALFLPITY